MVIDGIYKMEQGMLVSKFIEINEDTTWSKLKETLRNLKLFNWDGSPYNPRMRTQNIIVTSKRLNNIPNELVCMEIIRDIDTDVIIKYKLIHKPSVIK